MQFFISKFIYRDLRVKLYDRWSWSSKIDRGAQEDNVPWQSETVVQNDK